MTPTVRTPPAGATVTVTPTFPPQTSIVAQQAAAGARSITLVDASTFPSKGTLQIGTDPTKINYAKAANPNTLILASALPRAVAAGTAVKVVPCFGCGGQVIEVVGQGGGCAMSERGGDAGGIVIYGVAFMLWIGRRYWPARHRVD